MADYQPSAPNISNGPAPVGRYLTKFQSLKTERLDFDVKCQLISDYMLPRRDFNVTLRPNQLRPHRVTSSVGTALGVRLAANVLANMIDPTRPFLLPNVKRGLAMAGRDTDLDDDGINYLGAVSWSIFDRMMLPRAHLLERLGAVMNEFVFFGNGVIWTGRKRGFGPIYHARSFQACWWSENEHGEIDTLYFRVLMPVYRVWQRWPKSREQVPAWAQMKDGSDDEQQLTPVLICTEPRAGGRPGAMAMAKPFQYVCVAEEKKLILEESGFDSFPYAVFRYNAMPGQAYAEGPGSHALADVMVLNHLQQSVENIAEQKGQPPLAWPARMFPKPLDRRPGASNSYNPAGLGLQKASDAILKLDMTGDPGPVLDHIEYLTKNIGATFFEDWMKLRETGDMTAEEVSDRRSLRNDGIATIVANCAQPMTSIGDRTLEGLNEERMLPRPVPASVAGAEADWEYAGPLMLAQLDRVVQTTLQLINARGLVAEQDPAAAQAVDLESCLRTIHASSGAQMGTINSRAKVQDAREQQARQQLQQHNAAQLQATASAARDAGQGMNAMASAQAAGGAPGGPSGPAGMPGAPAAPVAFQPAPAIAA